MRRGDGQPVFVFGAGGHGKVVADVLRAGHWLVCGFVDDAPAATSCCGASVVTTSAWLQATVEAVALGVGDNAARARVAERVAQAGRSLVCALHPAAVVSSHARFAAGVVVMPGAIINADVQLNAGVIINSGAVVEHDCVVGAFAHVSCNATLGGGVHIGAGTLVGLGASVLPGTRVGAHCVVGAGAVVVEDVPDGQTVRGVPAR